MHSAHPSSSSPGFDVQQGGLRFETVLFRGGLAVATLLMGLVTIQVLGPLLPIGTAHFVLVPIIGGTALLAGTLPAVAVVVAVTGIECARLGMLSESLVLYPPEALTFAFFIALSITQIALVQFMHGKMHSLAFGAAEARTLARQQALQFAELQHRVANNFNVIGALLARRGREVTDPGARRGLDDAAARLTIAARVTRRLYDPSHQEVDLAKLLREMVPELISIAGAERRLTVNFDAEQVVIPALQAIPLALVAAELLSNAIEHGFPGAEGGMLEIRLEGTGQGTARLSLRHDGVALPPGFCLSRSRGLGLTIACQLAETAGADLMVVQDRGVVSCLTFPVVEARDPSSPPPFSANAGSTLEKV